MEKLTVSELKEMVNNQENVNLVRTLFEAIAYSETVRSIIDPYKLELLNKHQFKVDKKWLDDGETDKIIIDIESTYLMSDEDFDIYMNEMHDFYISEGFKVPKKGYCPLLMTESKVRDIKVLVADKLEPYLNISYSDISSNLKAYKKYYDLILTMFACKMK